MPLGIVLCHVIDEHLEAFFAATALSIQRIGA
jgi:hypothetical protein